MEIRITGDLVIDNLKSRTGTTEAKIRELAYERLLLTRRIEELDKFIGQLEGALVANGLVKKDIDVRETIIQAQREAAEKKAAETNKNMEVSQDAKRIETV